MNTEIFTSLLHGIDISSALLILNAVLLFVSLAILRRARRMNKGGFIHTRNMQNDIRAITTAAVSMGERVLELERRQRRLAERQDQMDVFEPANQQPYEQAIRMAQTGSSVKDLVSICGLSHNEAELIHMMHRFDKAS